jgi:hypothetical protein
MNNILNSKDKSPSQTSPCEKPRKPRLQQKYQCQQEGMSEQALPTLKHSKRTLLPKRGSHKDEVDKFLEKYNL